MTDQEDSTGVVHGQAVECKLAAPMRNLIREALLQRGLDPDIALEHIHSLLPNDPTVNNELKEILAESFQVAVAKVMAVVTPPQPDRSWYRPSR